MRFNSSRPYIAAIACGASLMTAGCFLLSFDGFPSGDDASVESGTDTSVEARADTSLDVASPEASGDAGCPPGTCLGPPTVLVLADAGLESPGQLVVDDAALYTVDTAALMIFRIDKQSGAVTPLVSSQPLQSPDALAIDATHVYFLDNGDATSSAGRGVYRVDKTGSNFMLLAQPPMYAGLNDIAVDSAWVYWSEGASHHIGRVSVDGGSYTAIFAMDRSDYDYSGGLGPLGLAVDSLRLYWADDHTVAHGGMLQSMNLDSGAIPDGYAANGPAYVALDDASIYWTSQGASTVNRLDKTTGQSVPLAGMQGVGVGQITTDATYVYWTNYDTGEVMRIAKTGSPSPTTLATGQSQPTGIAVDDVAVYWTNAGDGTVGMLAK